MASSFQCLLRLPACLRRQALLEAGPQRHWHVNADIGTKRSFSFTCSRLRQQRPSPRPGKPPAPKSPSQSPPRPSAPPPRATSAPAILYADQLLSGADRILLYKGPAHRSYKVTSYVIGGALLIGAYNWAQLLGKQPTETRPKGWLVSILYYGATWGTALFLTIMGSALLFAPANMIRSIALVAKGGVPGSVAGRQVFLRCEKESAIPFMKPKNIDIKPSEALLDKNVQAVDIDLTSVSLGKAKEWTATADQSAVAAMPKLQVGFVARAWSTFMRDIRRTFYREGLCYLRFGEYGSWKLDLQHCELLDQGRPLDRLTTLDLRSGIGPVAFLRRMVGM